jgi:hypothetical protein
MQETDFFVLKAHITGPPNCELDDAVNEPPLSPAKEGTPAAPTWPKKVKFRMSDGAPGIVVPDFIVNSCSFLMVSQRVKEHFEKSLKEMKEMKDKIEYLPFKILNHKDREVDGTFFAVNVLDPLDCIDVKRSKCEEDVLNDGWYEAFEELHLDVKKIPKGRRIFRLGSSPSFTVVHVSLKEEIEAARYSAAQFVPMGGPVRPIG